MKKKEQETWKILGLFKSNKNKTGDRICQSQKIIRQGQIVKSLEWHND